MPEKKDSPYLERAQEMLKAIQGQPQSHEEREKICLELASLLTHEAERLYNSSYNHRSAAFIELISKEKGKGFLTALVDQCFRKSPQKRRMQQLHFLLFQMGIPKDLPFQCRLILTLVKLFGSAHSILGSLVDYTFQKIIDKSTLSHDALFFRKTFELKKRHKSEPIIAYLDASILSDAEARLNLRKILADIANREIQHISLKLSSLLHPAHELSFYYQKEVLSERLKTIFRELLKYQKQGKKTSLVLDIGLSIYLDLTVTLFRELLEEEEFANLSIGITLQAYLPESFYIQQELTHWAKERVKNGKAPIKIRITKGAHLGEEKVLASKKGWPQAPFQNKTETDANFKKMVRFGLQKENIHAVHLGIATHNIFDLSYSLCLITESDAYAYVDFEFYENRLPFFRSAFQKLLNKDVLAYNIIDPIKDVDLFCSYLIRKFDDMGSNENFLFSAYLLLKDKSKWTEQETLFLESLKYLDTPFCSTRRSQNIPVNPSFSQDEEFDNFPQTDFSIAANRLWAEKIVEKWKNISIETLPIVIAGQEMISSKLGVKKDPSTGSAYKFSLAEPKELNLALASAQEAKNRWHKPKIELFNAALKIFKARRADIIGSLMMDAGKTLFEADVEVSSAIDSIEYAISRCNKIMLFQDVEWSPKGIVVIAPARGLPCVDPAGTIASALIAGNAVLFKPPPETVFIAWQIAHIFWDAGIPKDLLQFVPCEEHLLPSVILKDSRISSLITKCYPTNAKFFFSNYPHISLEATLPGKNAMIISSLSDQSLAIKDLITSSFFYAGQKYTSTSLAILEASIFDDPEFQKKLKETTESLIVGSVWNLATIVPPLIRTISPTLIEKILHLEEGEEWLVKPRQDEKNPNLWSPGIKWNVKPNSFSFQNVFLFPLLSVVRAKDFPEALQLANHVESSLVTTLHSLDEREHHLFLKNIRTTTTFINHYPSDCSIRKAPVGGESHSSIGLGFKDGGPNFIFNFFTPKQLGLPKEKLPINISVNNLTAFIEKIDLSAEQLGIWYASIANYAYWWNRLKHKHDPSKILGQDNLFGYSPRKDLYLRIEPNDDPFDALRICAAALTCGAQLTLSWHQSHNSKFDWNLLKLLLKVEEESEEELIKKIKSSSIRRLRLLSLPSPGLLNASRELGCDLFYDPVLSNGRIELLRCLKEMTKSQDYQRYGNLGLRECDLRKPIL